MSILYIDAENIRIREYHLIYIMILYNISKIFVYSDMNKNNLCQHYIDWCFKYNCFLIHVPSIKGKNSVDMQMTIDITEYCLNNNNNNILIASNDRDFTPLCLFLKSKNNHVILIAYDKLDDTIIDIVDDYHLINIIPIDLYFIIQCFIIKFTNQMTISQIKKLLKKFNKKKKMKYYTQILFMIQNHYNNIFKLENKTTVILKSRIFI